MKFRIIHYSSPNARINEAFEEAMLLARLRDQPQDTVHVWNNNNTVVLGSNVDVEASVDEAACKKNGVIIIRKNASSKAIYQDLGTLNLSYIIDQKKMFPNIEILSEVYKRLCEPIAYGLSKYGVEVKVDEYGQGIITNGRIVSEVGASFYYNLLYLHSSINVNTDLKLLSQVLRRKDFFTTLGSELNKTLGIEDVERTLIESIGKRLGLEFETQSLLSSEKKLAERLYEIKYSRDDWNLKMKGPLTLKDVLVDVYVAYPPTRSCKAIIENVNSAMEKVRDKIEMRIWMRGKGLNGQGVPPGVVMPGGLMKASKESIVPAVIINGQITFSRDVPSKEEVEREIYKVLRD